jgi:tetratricopeptide (TPR) repeat protein
MPRKRGSRRAVPAGLAGDRISQDNEKNAGAPVAGKKPSDARTTSEAGVRWHPLFALAPVALGLITSLNTLAGGFAADDSKQILNNGLIKNIGNMPDAFFTSVWAFASNDIVFATDTYYRPLFNVLLMVNYAIFGSSAWGWHLANALIHSGVVYLVYLLLKEITGDEWVAAISAVIFAVHPAHSESVAWISGITDPWMAVFALPAIYWYWKYAKGGSKSLLLASAGFYFLALLVKETAVAVLLLILFCEFWYFGGSRTWAERMKRAVGVLSVLAIPSAVYMAMRYHALSGVLFGSVPLYPAAAALKTVPLALIKYAGLMVVPAGYSYLHYVALVGSMGSVAFWGYLAAAISIGAAIILSRSRLLILCAVWFVVWLAPALAAIRRFDPEFIIQDRYLYIPSIGVCLALGLGLRWLASRRWLGISWRVPAIAVLAAMTIVLAGVYVAQNRVWFNDVSLYQNAVEVDPRSPFGRAFLADAYMNAGQPKEAEREAQAAVESGPAEPDAYMSLAYVADSEGKLDQAIRHLETGIEAIPEGPMTRYHLATMYLNLGQLYRRNKDLNRAEQCMRRSLELWLRPAGSYYLGEFYYDQSRYEEARDMYEKTREQVPPRFAPIHLKLGRVSDKLGDIARAKSEYQLYVDLAPQANNRQEILRRISEL